MKKFPNPTNTCEIKQYKGLCGNYRRFIPNFRTIAKPLTNLLRKNVPFVWDEKTEAFVALKEILTTEPLLQYPDFTKPFVLTTDASSEALGAILSQGPIGEDLFIAYASRTRDKAERNYSSTEMELLAMVWACKQYRPYLYGKKFTIVTDHKPLTWVFIVKDPSSRLLRWRLKLEEYNYQVLYKPGVRNTNADALSRITTPKVNHVVKDNSEISSEERKKMLQEFHVEPLGGHLGMNRTFDRIKLYMSCSGMKYDIEEYIRKCEDCQGKNYTEKDLTTITNYRHT